MFAPRKSKDPADRYIMVIMPAIKMDKMPQIAIMAIFGRFLNLLDNAM